MKKEYLFHKLNSNIRSNIYISLFTICILYNDVTLTISVGWTGGFCTARMIRNKRNKKKTKKKRRKKLQEKQKREKDRQTDRVRERESRKQALKKGNKKNMLICTKKY